LDCNVGLKGKSSRSFKKMFVLAFHNPILLRSSSARSLMKNAKRIIKGSGRGVRELHAII